MIKYCLPIIAPSTTAVASAIQGALDHYTYFEIWLEYLDKFDSGWIKALANEYGNRLIFLLRRQRLEPPKLSHTLQIETIKALTGTKSFLDLDLRTQAPLMEAARAAKLSTILSYHNYDSTPSDSELNKITDEIEQNGAAISKVATLCKTRSDALRLMELQLKLREAKRRCIVLGMGGEGAVTRVFGTLWGNEMIFAPETTDQFSAPGQLTRDELERIFRILRR